ncbi:MAG: 2-C-methyl-D-erythritol 4-phosphate cytidylyltransferase [Pyrinomonadaceae bacterium]
MNVAIIAAGGRGTRMGDSGGGRAKQYREISGIPLIIHTLRRFEQCATIDELIVAAPVEDNGEVRALLAKHGLRKASRVVAGGTTRTESVRRALHAVDATTAVIVAVHDAARPFVTSEEIDRTVQEAAATGAAVLVAPVIDTIKEVSEGRVVRTLERSRLRGAQTPQCFRFELLWRAYEQALAENVEATDDSALVERLGALVSIVEGGAHNIKITTPQDFALAEILLKV